MLAAGGEEEASSLFRFAPNYIPPTPIPSVAATHHHCAIEEAEEPTEAEDWDELNVSALHTIVGRLQRNQAKFYLGLQTHLFHLKATIDNDTAKIVRIAENDSVNKMVKKKTKCLVWVFRYIYIYTVF